MSTVTAPPVDHSRPVRLFDFDGVTAVWGFLVIASLVTFWIGFNPELNPRFIVAGMLLIAFVKAWFVGVYFMETRRASRKLTTAFTVWLAVSSLATLAIVLIG